MRLVLGRAAICLSLMGLSMSRVAWSLSDQDPTPQQTTAATASGLPLRLSQADTSGASESSVARPSSGPAGQGLEEVVVTATRREESKERVPISILALTQDDLTQANIKSINDIAAVTPGLQFATPNYPSTITSISIRGLNTQSGASVVGVYLDDIPIQNRLSGLTQIGNPYPVLFDLNRVEVDRGPQGTLFGSGSEAGAVRFITNAPSLTNFSGYAHSELASTEGGTGSYEVGAALGGPIVQDKAGFRLSLWDRHDGGYVNLISPIDGTTVVTPNVNKGDKLALRGAMAFQVNEDVRITPSLYFQRVRTGDSGVFFGQFSDAATGNFNNGNLLPERSSDHYYLPSIKLEAHLPFADLTGTVSYLNRRVDVDTDISVPFGAAGLVHYGNPLGSAYPTSPADVAPWINIQTDRAFTEEVRLASNRPDALVSWVAGVFIDHRVQNDVTTFYDKDLVPSGLPDQYYNQTITDEQVAGYGQGDVHLTRRWTVTLGGRVARLTVNQRNITGPYLLDAGIPPLINTPTFRDTPFTPKATVSFQADPNNLFYVSASEGFRPGGGNEPLLYYCGSYQIPATFGADNVWNYELGAKNKFFDGRLQIDTSVFHMVWSKIQQVLTLSTCGNQYTANAGTAVSNGFDLDLQAVPIDHLRLSLVVGYVNAYYTSTVLNSAGQPIVQEGDKIGFLPQVNAPWNVIPSATYEFSLPQGEKLNLRAEYRYNSRNPGPFATSTLGNPAYFPLDVPDPPTHIFNARLGTAINKVDVALFVNNAFNSHPLLSKYQYNVANDFVTYSTLRPRTVGLSANVAF
jgi:iron complex outermembrane receptor protein